MSGARDEHLRAMLRQLQQGAGAALQTGDDALNRMSAVDLDKLAALCSAVAATAASCAERAGAYAEAILDASDDEESLDRSA